MPSLPSAPVPPEAVPSLQEFADRLLALSADGTRQIVGIIGAPGTGKSTVAQEIAELIGGQCVVVPMDGFHLSQRVISGTDLEGRKGAIDTFDVGGYVSLLRRLRDNDEDIVYAPDYRRDLEEPVAASIAVPSSMRIVLTEGNYLLAEQGRWSEIDAYLDETWFVDTPREIRLSRLINRHVEFGKDRDEATRWATGPDESNAKIVEGTRTRADRVIPWG